MSISRRNFVIRGGTSTSALAFLRAVPGSAADSFRPELLPSVAESWQDVRLVNNEWGPTRLPGSWQHEAHVQFLKHRLTEILHPVGGAVFEDTFANVSSCRRTQASPDPDSKRHRNSRRIAGRTASGHRHEKRSYWRLADSP